MKSILASRELQLQIVSEELTAVVERFGDARRTDIVFDARDFTIEDMIANEDVIVTISHKGFIKRTPVNNYRRQGRGGRGLSGAGTYDDDFVENLFRAQTHNYLLCFTDQGRVFRVKVYDIPEGSRNAKGRSIANVIQKSNDEKVTAYLLVQGEFTDDQFIFMCTKQGTVKKTTLSEFESVRQNGKIALTLDEGDILLSARLTDGTNDIIIGTHEGMACRFRESDVRSMGRNATGVRGIDLQDDDYVVSMVAIKRSDSQVLVIGANGYGKRTRYEDFRLTRRGAKGVYSMNVTDKTGKVVSIIEVTDSDDLVVMTQGGILIRQPASEIRVIGRNTQGVRLIRLDEGDTIADITSVPRDEEDEMGDETESTTPVLAE
ncbi:MAG: hypothetical protein JNJ85_05685 [Candidatus Kapabacteria bacterium]|nr:hypothetical protein [Candidatus Kapabacteria bacterium]